MSEGPANGDRPTIKVRYPIGFSITVTGVGEPKTLTITAYVEQTASEFMRDEPPRFDYVVRDSNRTAYLVTHEYLESLEEMMGGGDK